ncbi:MAG: hypothetical protein CUN56_09110, partial [Phototrophicales bacterium]
FEIVNHQTQQYATIQVQPIAQTTYYHAIEQSSYAVVIIHDTTTSKQLEQTLRQMNLELEKRVQERTAELEQTNLLLQKEINQREMIALELEQALQEEKELNAFKARFGTLVSHEFRTPLAIIQTSVDIIERYNHQITDERRQELTHNIRTQIKHLTKLLDDIYMVSRAETVGIDMTRDWVHLRTFIDQIVNGLSQLAHADRQFIYTNHIDQDIKAYIDRRLIHQMITNLVSNAIKYSKAGTSITLNTYHQDHDFIIEVSDEGIGIPIEAQEHLFDVFYRASNVTEIGGTGIGLAIVKLAVDLHQGHITFTSEPNQGTTFKVKIPLGKES